MKTVGVVLSGCGFLDGAEIYESVLTLLHLDRQGLAYQCLAPDISQMHVINHHSGDVSPESRNVLTESARIARGKIEPLDDAWVEKLDAVIFPGGFGAAKNYCDYAVKGDSCMINRNVESFMRSAVKARIPIGAICIAPLVLARALTGTGIRARLTVGSESSAAKSVEQFGATHVVCSVTDVVVDMERHIVSTPAYMYSPRISEVEIGIEKLVSEIARMVKTSARSSAKAISANA